MPRRAHPLYGVIGKPIDRVRSPGLFNASLAQKRLPGVMSAFDVAPERLANALVGLRALDNLVGFLVTMPHKIEIVALLDEMTQAARIAGAVNIVRRETDGRLVGGQLDGAGFVGALRKAGFEPAGRRALVVGAGGVGAGICAALAEAGMARVAIANRSPARADALVARLSPSFPQTRFDRAEAAATAEHDLVVNATSLGSAEDDPLPIDLSGLRSDAVAADVVTKPPVTPFLAQAESHGCLIQRGDAMIHTQIELMHDFFAGA